MKFEIRDWAGNRPFGNLEFESFEQAWNYIEDFHEDADEDTLGEFFVESK